MQIFNYGEQVGWTALILMTAYYLLKPIWKAHKRTKRLKRMVERSVGNDKRTSIY